DASLGQRGKQRGLVDHRTAGDVDQVCVRLHRIQHRGVHQAASLRRQRCGEDEVVAPAGFGCQVVAGDDVSEVGVVGDGVAPCAPDHEPGRAQQLGDLPPDAAGADHQGGGTGDASRLAVLPLVSALQVEAGTAVLGERDHGAEHVLGQWPVEDATRVGDDDVGIPELVEEQGVDACGGDVNPLEAV